MSITIETHRLIEFLDALAPTTGKSVETEGFLMFEARGPFGDEPGETSLLAGLATNGVVSTHYYVPFESGSVEKTFWPVSVLKLITSAFGARADAAKENSAEHVLQVTQLVDEQVEVVEAHHPDDGVTIKFNVMDPSDFPAVGVIALLVGERRGPARVGVKDEVEVLDGPYELWDADGLGLLLRLAKKRKTKLLVEKTVSNGVVRASFEGCDNWVGAVVPPAPMEGARMNAGVNVEVYLDVPDLPDEDTTPGSGAGEDDEPEDA